MSDVTIISNNKPRLTLYWHDLTAKEQADHDYLDSQESQECASFVRYKGYAYNIGEFMRVAKDSDHMPGWHGYHSDSYFSGILLKLCDDSDYVIMGRYYS